MILRPILCDLSSKRFRNGKSKSLSKMSARVLETLLLSRLSSAHKNIFSEFARNCSSVTATRFFLVVYTASMDSLN